MQKTTNYELNKPEATDQYNIEHFNDNADTIDTQIKANADNITALDSAAMKKASNLSDLANKSTAMDNIASSFNEATDANVNDDSTFVLGKKTSWFKIKFSSFWKYIRDKIHSILGLYKVDALADGNYNDCYFEGTSAKATNADLIKTIDTTNGDKLQIGSGTSINVTNSKHSATADNLSTARTIDGMDFNGSENIIHYGTCTTVAATAAKTVSLTGFKLSSGSRISVRFQYANSATTPTLNINGTGAKAIRLQNNVTMTAAVAATLWKAYQVVTLIYDGSYWLIDKAIDISGNANTATSAGKWTSAITIKIQDNDGSNTESTGTSIDGSADKTLKLPSTIKASIVGNADSATSATTATKLGSATKGSSTKPIYLSSGAPTECSTYAGGTAVTLNGTSKGGSTASFYAPTSYGTSGKILKANGSGNNPTWVYPFTLTSTSKITFSGTGWNNILQYDNDIDNSLFVVHLQTSSSGSPYVMHVFGFEISDGTIVVQERYDQTIEVRANNGYIQVKHTGSGGVAKVWQLNGNVELF